MDALLVRALQPRGKLMKPEHVTICTCGRTFLAKSLELANHQQNCSNIVGFTGFAAILREVQEMHDRKSRDYGREKDPYYNIRGSEEFGIPAWVGAVLRANDKMKRLQLAAQGGTLANEGVEDSLLDMITYLTIALDCYRKER
jgi:hypothetical protein